MREWNAIGRPQGPTMHLSDTPITSLSVASDGTRVAIGTSDGRARVFALPSGQPVSTRFDVSRGSAGVALSPDGQRLVTLNSDHDCQACVVLYDLTGATTNGPLRGKELLSPELRYGSPSPGVAAAFDASGTSQMNTAFRSRQSMLLTWSASATASGFPDSRTSNG